MKRLLCAASAVIALSAAPAAAGDIAAAPPDKAPAAVIPVLYDWTGFYIGAHVTGSWTRSNGTTIDTTTGLVVGTDSVNRSAVHGGGQIGYDYMFINRVVLGIVADAQSGASNSTCHAGTVVQTTRSTEMGSGSRPTKSTPMRAKGWLGCGA